MENYKNIIEQMKKNNAEIKEIENFFDGLRYPAEIKITPQMVKAAKAARQAASEKRGERLQNLKIENAILRDNARRAYAADVLPAVLAILKKYDGKAYGEKTRDKMRDELKAAKSCAFHISREYYRDELHLVPLDEKGYSLTFCNYSDFEFSTSWTDGSPRLLNDNKINGKITPDELRLQNCGEYVENVPERVKQIKSAYAAALAAESAARQAATEYNKLLPSGTLRRFELGGTNYSTPI